MRVLTGSYDSTAKLWDAETGQEIRTFGGHTGHVRSVAFSPDGARVLTGSDDGTAKLWDAETGQEIHTFGGHTDRVRSVAFSPDGTRVLTGSKVISLALSPDRPGSLTVSEDWIARLWDSETGQEIRTFGGHTDWVNSVAFSPDGTQVLTGSEDGTARIWQLLQPEPP
jgi:WD40 repeat protein